MTWNKQEKPFRRNGTAFLLFLCLCGTTLSAQDVVQHKRGEDLQQYMLDSVKFVNPEFQAGVVVFVDGSYSRAPLNISTIEQRVYFISPAGETQVLSNEDQVKRVSIMSRSFVKSRYGYVELLKVTSDAGIGAVRRVSFFETEKKGAYGSTSQTTSVTTVGTVFEGGVMYTLGVDQSTPFKYKVIPYLLKNDKVLISNKKNLQKCFPEKKSAIEAYLGQHSVDFENIEDMLALFKALTEQ